MFQTSAKSGNGVAALFEEVGEQQLPMLDRFRCLLLIVLLTLKVCCGQVLCVAADQVARRHNRLLNEEEVQHTMMRVTY